MNTAQAREHTRERAASLCGPEVLAEVLRRKSGGVGEREPARPGSGRETVEALARELKTDHHGTSLAALALVARKRGLEAKGLRLTWNGLYQQFHAEGSGRGRQSAVGSQQSAGRLERV